MKQRKIIDDKLEMKRMKNRFTRQAMRQMSGRTIMRDTRRMRLRFSRIWARVLKMYLREGLVFCGGMELV